MEEGKSKYERSTAKLCKISELITGKYIKNEGWTPNFVITDYGKIKRANIMGIIVNNDNTSCIIDDGTGKIMVRDFNNTIKTEIGELVVIIGKPRQFGQEMFLNNEIIKRIKNMKWVEFRKKELLSRKKEKINIPSDYLDVETDVKEEILIKEENIFEVPTLEPLVKSNVKTKGGKAERIIELIEKFDSGDGAHIENVIKESGLDDTETIIKSLTEEGEVFQVKPGRLKVM